MRSSLVLATVSVAIVGCETLKTHLQDSGVSNEARLVVFDAQAQQAMALAGQNIAVCMWVDQGDGDWGPPWPEAVPRFRGSGIAALPYAACINREPGFSITLTGEEKPRPVAFIENGNATRAVSGELFVSGSTTLDKRHWSGDYKVVGENGQLKVVDGPKP
jgi:hypothetical protein